jgi:translation initiation factor 2 subunit 2
MMQRDPQNAYQLFMAELGTEGTIDGNQRLIIRSPNAELVKDQGSRLYFCNCRDCGSSRGVVPIESGSHALSLSPRRPIEQNSGTGLDSPE